MRELYTLLANVLSLVPSGQNHTLEDTSDPHLLHVRVYICLQNEPGTMLGGRLHTPSVEHSALIAQESKVSSSH